jgi:hypothetical protein
MNKVAVSLVPLDYLKLKKFFLDPKSHEVHICATLQALRWRVTRVKPFMRRQVLTSYTHYDVLDCQLHPIPQNEIKSPVKSVFESLYYAPVLR